jgi:hypothetical protein
MAAMVCESLVDCRSAGVDSYPRRLRGPPQSRHRISQVQVSDYLNRSHY